MSELIHQSPVADWILLLVLCLSSVLLAGEGCCLFSCFSVSLCLSLCNQSCRALRRDGTSPPSLSNRVRDTSTPASQAHLNKTARRHAQPLSNDNLRFFFTHVELHEGSREYAEIFNFICLLLAVATLNICWFLCICKRVFVPRITSPSSLLLPYLDLWKPSIRLFCTCFSLLLKASVPISSYLPHLPVSMPFALPLSRCACCARGMCCRFVFPVLWILLKALHPLDVPRFSCLLNYSLFSFPQNVFYRIPWKWH